MRYLASCLIGLCSACSPVIGPSGDSGPTTPICWECPPPPNDTTHAQYKPLTIEKAATASGDSQTGPVGTALPHMLRVRVSYFGFPQQGYTVTWGVTASGSATNADATPPPGASVNPTTSVTDSLGIATTTWTLGNALGVQTAQATLPAAQSPFVMFTATATPRP